MPQPHDKNLSILTVIMFLTPNISSSSSPHSLCCSHRLVHGAAASVNIAVFLQIIIVVRRGVSTCPARCAAARERNYRHHLLGRDRRDVKDLELRLETWDKRKRASFRYISAKANILEQQKGGEFTAQFFPPFLLHSRLCVYLFSVKTKRWDDDNACGWRDLMMREEEKKNSCFSLFISLIQILYRSCMTSWVAFCVADCMCTSICCTRARYVVHWRFTTYKYSHASVH